MIPWLASDDSFPDVSQALTKTTGVPGLLAAGGDLSPQRLLQAYQQGIFPWFSEGQPILWWSTDPRMVLPTDEFIISDSLKKSLKKVQKSLQTDQRWQIHFDHAFEEVMCACAAPRLHQTGTWISKEIIQAYVELHHLGYAHSSELWLDGKLVGGAYGICIGKMFFGESMFSYVNDASKIALAFLVRFLKKQGVEMIDCQQVTRHLASLGGIVIARDDFIHYLRQAVHQAPILNWQPDTEII